MRRLLHMNETINLEPRQAAIVTLLVQQGELSRVDIAEKLAPMYSVSRATLARDLNTLVAHNVLQALGKGPRRIYKALSEHPLIKLMDLKHYFAIELDQRTAKTMFASDIFVKLPGVIFPDDRKALEHIFRSFSATKQNRDATLWHRELERFMIELSWKSSRIEGNTYSLLETETLIKQNQEAYGKTHQEATMILNHKNAFKLIVEHQDHFKTLSFDLITQLHNVLTQGLSITSGIRKHAVGITGTTYIPWDNEWQTKEMVEKLTAVVNTVDHPLEKALITLSMISYIQPFADGNKRTARMLANAILMAHDYFPLSYRSVDENEYKQALIVFYETNNLYHIKRLFLDQYQFATKTYFL